MHAPLLILRCMSHIQKMIAYSACRAPRSHMKQLPIEVWRLIAQHVPILPWHYIRLAAVNRMFYKVFMSDVLWSKMDVYGCKHDIAEDFIGRNYLNSKPSLMKYKKLSSLLDVRGFSVFSDVRDLSSFCDDGCPVREVFKCFNRYLLNSYDIFAVYLYPHAQYQYGRTPYLDDIIFDKVMMATGNLKLMDPRQAPNPQHLQAAILRRDDAIGLFKSHQIDRKTWLLAVHCNGAAYKIIPGKLRSDKGFALDVIRGTPRALEYAPNSVRSDKEVVMASVNIDPTTLKFASSALRDDPNVVMACILANPQLLRYASNRLKRDRDFILTAISAHDVPLEFTSKDLRDDPEVVLAAVSRHGTEISLCSDSMRANYQIVKTAVSQDGMLLECCPHFHDINHKGAKDIIYTALRQTKMRVVERVPLIGLTDPAIIREVLGVVEESGMKRTLRAGLLD